MPPRPSATCPSPADLLRLLGEDAALTGRDAVEAHVEGCPFCQEELERLTHVGPLLVPGPDADPTPWYSGGEPRTLVVGRPAEVAPWPAVPGYRITSEVGFGGMGVVYRAWDDHLQRVVALKFLHPAVGRDADRRARFLNEAQLVARLQHPNVVQIYEMGDCDGRPYLALEFVAGETLADQLRGQPQAPVASADLAVTLARAVHAAHEQGVIHRDLKPSNVLMAAAPDRKAVAGTTFHGVPKVADFGLGKLRAEDDGTTPGPGDPTKPNEPTPPPRQLTATGELLGTPSYMAPEQATPRGREVGPAADVYSLGSILYELLTGRPPFVGPTPMVTLLMVTTREPVPPRQLSPGVPRDLETICLKCLEKDPTRRYATAAALADDLARFRAGESILARPVGPVGRVTRAARRKPLVAGLLGATAAVCAVAAGLVVWQWREAVGERDAKGRALEYAEEKRAEAEGERALKTTALEQKAAALERAVAQEKETATARDRAAAEAKRARAALAELSSIAVEEYLIRMPVGSEEQKRFMAALAKLYDEVASDPAADRAARRASAEALQRASNIHRHLRNDAAALAALRRSLAMATALAAEAPADHSAAWFVAQVRGNLARCLDSTGARAEAAVEFRAALAELRRLAAARPDDALYQRDLGSAASDLAFIADLAGDAAAFAAHDAEAERALRRSLEIREFDAWQRFVLARLLGRRGVFHSGAGRFDVAEPALAEAVRQYERATQKAGVGLGHLFIEGELYRGSHGAALVHLGRAADGLAKLDEAVANLRRIVDAYPSHPDVRARLAIVLVTRYSNGKSRPDALPLLREALALGEGLVREFPDNPHFRENLGDTLTALGLHNWDDPAADTEAHLRAAAHHRGLLADRNPTRVGSQTDAVGAFTNLGAFLLRTRRTAEGRDALRGAERYFAGCFPAGRPAAERPTNFFRMNRTALVRAYLVLGEYEAAAALAPDLTARDDSADGWVYRATMLGMCARRAATDAELTPERQVERANELAAAALADLRQAVARGFRDEATLRRCVDFRYVRTRPEYEAVMRELFPPVAPPPRRVGD